MPCTFWNFLVAKLADPVDNLNMDDETQPLYWEPTFEVALALIQTYPNFDIESIGMKQLKDMIIALPNFADDPGIASEELLRGILNEWYEEQENA